MRRPCRSLPSRSCPCPTSGTALQTSRNATGRGAHLGDPMLRSQHIDVGLKTLPDKWHDLVDVQKCYSLSPPKDPARSHGKPGKKVYPARVVSSSDEVWSMHQGALQ